MQMSRKCRTERTSYFRADDTQKCARESGGFALNDVFSNRVQFLGLELNAIESSSVRNSVEASRRRVCVSGLRATCTALLKWPRRASSFVWPSLGRFLSDSRPLSQRTLHTDRSLVSCLCVVLSCLQWHSKNLAPHVTSQMLHAFMLRSLFRALL